MQMNQRTYTPRGGEVTRAWRVVDAADVPLGRLASQVAGYLRGKHLPTFAEHMDLGDFVVVVNATSVRVTGNKLRQKMYFRHSGYPGGFKAVALGDLLAKHPERVVKHAVKGMLPHNTLGRKLLRKLKVYGGTDHPHLAQLRATERAAQPRAATAPPRTTDAGETPAEAAEPARTTQAPEATTPPASPAANTQEQPV